MPVPAGFEPATEYETVDELRRIVEGLELPRTVFRANHTSNPLPLSGRLPADKEKLLRILETELDSGRLDRNTPGPEIDPWML